MTTLASRRSAALAGALLVATLTAGCSGSGNSTASPTPAPAATVTETVTETATPSATPPPTASPSSTATPTASPSSPTTTGSAPKAVRAFGYVRQVITKEGARQLVWDRAALLTGAAAKKAKKAHGLNPNEPPDYYILNDDTTQRLHPLVPGYTVVGRTFFGKPPTGGPVSRATFEKAFPSTNTPPMYIYFDDADRVIKVVEVYTP